MSRKKPVRYNNLGPFSEERITLSEKLFHAITPVMNTIHNMQHSKRFWMLATEEYIRSVIKTKYLLDRKVLNLKPALFPMETAFELPGMKDNLRQKAGKFSNFMKTRRNGKITREKLKNYDHLYFGFPIVPFSNTDKKSCEIHPYHSYFFGSGEKSKRAAVNRLAEKENDIYLKNIIRLLPGILVEHFAKLYRSIPLLEPETKRLHIHNLNTPFEHLLVAKYLDSGAKLIWYQHGALYGEIKVKYRYWFEQAVCDEFRTWGWKLNGKDVPGKAYRLEKFKRALDSYQTEKEYDLMICYPNIHKGNREEFNKRTELILSKCDTEEYKKILARPRPINSRHDQSEVLGFINDERVTISSSLNNIAEEVSKSRIVLQMEIPSTNFMECIYSDQPVIGILSNNQPTDIIKPHYNFFLENGIMHSNWESLVAHLNSINIEAWWKGITESPEYKSYKETYTRAV